MNESDPLKYIVAVIGAGPAGLYASQYLARQGVQVVLFNRDIKPGGLAEYGIFPTKQKMRSGLRRQFRQILAMDRVYYLGNITIGQRGDLRLDQLRQAGFHAIMVTIGAQKNNWLGLPGEDLKGVYQANDIVFYYNALPELAGLHPIIGDRVVIIGTGNVMLDIVHYLQLEHRKREVIAFARRGPSQVKFDRQTLEPIASCLNMSAIKVAVDEAKPAEALVGGDLEGFYSLIQEAQKKVPDLDAHLRLSFSFLRSPRRLLGDSEGRVKGIVFEINRLVREAGKIQSRGTGVLETIQADTVIFSIGSRVDESFGLPVAQKNFITAPSPRFPVDGISYEVYNSELCAPCEDVFVSGWARQEGKGVVGRARKDAERGARAVLKYLKTLSSKPDVSVQKVLARLPEIEKRMVDLDDLARLEEAEKQKAAAEGLQEFKFSSREEMLRVIEES